MTDTPASLHGCRLDQALEVFLAEEIDPEGRCSTAPTRLHQARLRRAETSEVLKNKTSQLAKLQAFQCGPGTSKKEFLREISRAKIAVEKAKVNDEHAFAQILRAEEALLLWRAVIEVRALIEKHDGWFFDYSGLSPSDNELMFTSPSSQPCLTALQFSMRLSIWKPFIGWFMDGRWIAKGRLANFGGDPKILPASLFTTAIKLHLPHSEIIEGSDHGARFVDVEVYSKDCLPQALNSETVSDKPGLVLKRGGRPPEKQIERAFYSVFDRYRREGLPEGKTRLVEDIIHELIALNESAGRSTVRDWLVKHARPFYEACGLPINFGKKDP
jgi:hypothetical protein